MHQSAKSLYFERVKRQIRIHAHMHPKPVLSSQCCNARVPGVVLSARARLSVSALAAVSCLGAGIAYTAPARAWEVSVGEAVVVQELVVQEPVVDARAQRRATLRRALVEGSRHTRSATPAKPMSRDERDMLNRELREVMRGAYDEYVPSQ